LTVLQLEWLQKYAASSWDRTNLKAILLQVQSGELALWMLADSEAQGLIGTKLPETNQGRILWIEFLVGEGLLKDAIPIRQALHDLALGAGCVRLEGIVSRPGLARLYERVLGVKPSAQIFREEF
jgi:hypothetical protein